MGKAETAFQRTAEIYDTTIGWRFINPLMKAQYGVDSMPETGENVAQEFQVSRADQDAFAYRSQQRAAKRAWKRAVFDERIVAGRSAGRQGRADYVVGARRASARGHHARRPRQTEADRARGRDGDCRQCLRGQRRRGGAGRCHGRGG